jgi:hypothetical protein
VNYKDYAIFYSDKIGEGLRVGKPDLNYNFILGYGNINLVKDYFKRVNPGESGSPYININGEVFAILSGFGTSTDINIVLQAIDNMK